MTRNRKGRDGCHQATPNTSNFAFYFTVIATHFKAAIVTLTLWGWLPMCLSKWISNRGVQHND